MQKKTGGIKQSQLDFREDSRCFKNFIPASFRTDLSMVPWHLIQQEHNPDIALDIIMLWIYLIYYLY